MSTIQPAKPPTVGEVVAALLKFDQSLPVLVSTHYDNDTEHSSRIFIEVSHAEPEGDGDIWRLIADNDVSDPNFKQDYPEAIKAVTITA